MESRSWGLGRGLQTSHEGPAVRLAFQLGDGLIESHGRGELREIELPVNFPMALMHVDDVFKKNCEIKETGPVIIIGVESHKVAFHFRNELLAPPIQEVVGVIGKRPSKRSFQSVTNMRDRSECGLCSVPHIPNPRRKRPLSLE